MERKRIDISTTSLEDKGIPFDEKRFKNLSPPLVMGILNVTPDSFSDGGYHDSTEKAVDHALKMVSEGADIIDVGGESTRPFADPVPLEEEISRVMPVIEALVSRVEVPISIDTRHAEVARRAIDAGASIINDVNALGEPGMDTVAMDNDATVILMHMKGTPKDMQVTPSYDQVMDEVRQFLERRMEDLMSKGMKKERMILDPGIGFGKRVEDNLMILKKLHRFDDLGCPLLVGASRKSFIGRVLDLDVDDRLEGSLASAVIAYLHGASIVRAHDVLETRRALDLADAVINTYG